MVDMEGGPWCPGVFPRFLHGNAGGTLGCGEPPVDHDLNQDCLHTTMVMAPMVIVPMVIVPVVTPCKTAPLIGCLSCTG